MKPASILLALAAAACAPNTTVWTRPGSTKPDFDRDYAVCKAQAETGASGQLIRSADRAQIHNRILGSCMRDRGYMPVEEAR